MSPKGLFQEKSEPFLKFQRPLPESSKTTSKQPSLARFPANRALTLELASFLEPKHPLAYAITRVFSIGALSMTNLRKVTSFRSPRKSRNAIRVMCDRAYFMALDSCLPVDSVISLDRTLEISGKQGLSSTTWFMLVGADANQS